MGDVSSRRELGSLGETGTLNGAITYQNELRICNMLFLPAYAVGVLGWNARLRRRSALRTQKPQRPLSPSLNANMPGITCKSETVQYYRALCMGLGMEASGLMLRTGVEGHLYISKYNSEQAWKGTFYFKQV